MIKVDKCENMSTLLDFNLPDRVLPTMRQYTGLHCTNV